MTNFNWIPNRAFFFTTAVYFVVRCFAMAGTPSPPTLDDQARAILDQWGAAIKAKDTNAVAHLLSKDCVIIIPETVGVSAHARFYTRDTYRDLLKQRYSETTASNSKTVIRNISSSNTGDIFVTVDHEERTRTNTRSEWIRSHEYIVMRRIEGNLLIAIVVAEASFYAPDVPPEPTVKPNGDVAK